MGVRKLKYPGSTTVQIDVDGNNCDLPVIIGSENEKAIDISTLRSSTTTVTLDNAFVNTASCTSDITFLDGENGILRYRGYPIEELAEHADFIEVSYLLIFGELPSAEEKATLEKTIAKFSHTDNLIKDLIAKYPKDAHPMGVLSAMIVSLSSLDGAHLDQDLSDQQKMESIGQLMAQLKNISSYFYRSSQGLPLIESDPQLDYCSDFLNMMFGKIDKDMLNVLNVLLILHADHEQNCSTSSVRLVGSSKANPYATIASGINALWGPLHGGANQAVIEMLEEIHKDGGDYKKFLDKAKDKSDPFKLMGFGHRVYKNFDPRAKIIKKACDTVLLKLKINDPLLDIAKGLEEEALKDPYFVERKLYPNVDFYSGIIYKALDIPTNMFTVMFALGRLPGWIAQWKEMLESPKMKIGRPRQIYTGKTKRHIEKK